MLLAEAVQLHLLLGLQDGVLPSPLVPQLRLHLAEGCLALPLLGGLGELQAGGMEVGQAQTQRLQLQGLLGLWDDG